MENASGVSNELLVSFMLEDLNTAQAIEGNSISDVHSDQQVARNLFRQDLERDGALQSGQSMAHAQLHELEAAYGMTSQDVAAIPQQNSAVPTAECAACFDTRGRCWMLTNSCGHSYCSKCVETVVRRATQAQEHFPPGCCQQPFNVEDAHKHISWALRTKFEQKTIEFTTNNPTYCAHPSCSNGFIPPVNIVGNVASCVSCRTATCVQCKGVARTGSCPPDPAGEALQRTAQNEGWKRCYNCHQTVELTTGCNHIRCRCGAEFCYQCEARWTTCRCPIWEERRLLHRQAELNAQAAAAAAREPAAAAARQPAAAAAPQPAAAAPQPAVAAPQPAAAAAAARQLAAGAVRQRAAIPGRQPAAVPAQQAPAPAVNNEEHRGAQWTWSSMLESIKDFFYHLLLGITIVIMLLVFVGIVSGLWVEFVQRK